MTFSKARLSLVATFALILGMALGPAFLEAQSNTIVAAAAGTITTSNPLIGAQTWNAGGVSFMGLQLNITETASAAGSHYLDINGGAGGVTSEFFVAKGGAVTALGGVTAASFNGNTFTTGTGTLTLAASKTLTASNTLTLAGTDGTTETFQPTSGTAVNAVPTFQSSASLGSSPVTLTAAQCGQAFNLDAATGVVYILPSTLGPVGCTYDFRVTVSVTSNAHEIESGNAAHFFTGDPIMIATGATLATAMCDGSSAIAYKSNGTTTGGLIGSRYRVTVQSATLLLIEGINAGSGSLSTACSASN